MFTFRLPASLAEAAAHALQSWREAHRIAGADVTEYAFCAQEK
jgi:hypothetical protein